MRKIILLVLVIMLVGCSEGYIIKEPVSADSSYFMKYTVEYEDGSMGTINRSVSKELYDQYINEISEGAKK